MRLLFCTSKASNALTAKEELVERCMRAHAAGGVSICTFVLVKPVN